MLRKLIWLIKHQEELKKLLESGKKVSNESYSLKGVPESQLEYINKILEEK